MLALAEELQHDAVVGGLVHLLYETVREGKLGENEVDLFPVQGPRDRSGAAHFPLSAAARKMRWSSWL